VIICMYNCSLWSPMVLCIYIVIILIPHFSSLIFIYLGILSLFHPLAKCLSILFIFPKISFILSIIHITLVSIFICLYSDLCYFFPSASFALALFEILNMCCLAVYLKIFLFIWCEHLLI
jgi:hypothetical protein